MLHDRPEREYREAGEASGDENDADWQQPMKVTTRLSEFLWPQQCVGQVNRQPHGDEGRERIVEDH